MDLFKNIIMILLGILTIVFLIYIIIKIPLLLLGVIMLLIIIPIKNK